LRDKNAIVSLTMENGKIFLVVKLSMIGYLTGLLAFFLWVGRPFYFSGVGMQITHSMTLLLILVFALNKLMSNNLELCRLPSPILIHVIWLFASIVLILTAGFLSMSNAVNIVEALKFQVSYLMGLAILLVFLGASFSYDWIRFLLRVTVTGAVLSVIFAFAGFLFAPLGEVTLNQFNRAQGFLLHPNQFGMMLAALFPAACAHLSLDFRKIKQWIVTLLLAGGLVISGSKTNLLIAGVLGPATLLIMNTFKHKYSQRMWSLLGTLIAVSCIGAAAFFLLLELVPETFRNLQLVLANPEEYRTLIIRQEIWHEALTLVKGYPNFGIGAGNTETHLGINHAHNVFIEYYLTLGRFGLFAFTSFLESILFLSYYVLKTSRKLSLDQQATAVGLVFGILSYIFSNQLSDSFGGTTLPLLWVLLGLLMAQGTQLFMKSSLD